jgi:hypothetical protein
MITRAYREVAARRTCFAASDNLKRKMSHDHQDDPDRAASLTRLRSSASA